MCAPAGKSSTTSKLKSCSGRTKNGPRRWLRKKLYRGRSPRRPKISWRAMKRAEISSRRRSPHPRRNKMVDRRTTTAVATITDAKKLNFLIARRFEEVAQLLEEQGGNPYRVQAYRRAADTLRRLPRSAAEIVRQEGESGLRRLPGIGESLARSIATLALTGKLPMLHRMRGESEAGLLLASVPGIGKRLAERLHHDLGIDSLEELEAAAHDGRVE